MDSMTTITRTKRELLHRLIERNRLNFGLLVAAILQAIVLQLWFKYDVINLFSPTEYVDEIMCWGLGVKIEEDVIPSDGDIEIVDKLKEESKIIDAPDPYLIGATEPIDLSPSIKPKLTNEAKENGVEGTLTLEIIIADTGDVLQVKSIGKKLGYGLEENAIKTYKAKKFSPSFVDGKTVTVKKLVPVRFKLESP